ILREAQVARWHELGLAERARPRALQPFELDVSPIDDLERIEELRPEHRATPLVVGKRHERRNRRPHAGKPAEVRLEAPDRYQYARVDTVLISDTVHQRAMPRVHLLG